MSGIRWIQTLGALFVTVLFQVTVFDAHWLFGIARIDLCLVLVIAVAAVANADDAARVGFTAGLMVDLFQFGPFGLNALVLALVGWSLAAAKVRMLAPGAVFQSVQAMAATAAATIVIWTAGAIFGLTPPPFRPMALVSVALIGMCGGVLVHPAIWVAGKMVEARSNADRRGTASFIPN